LLECFIELHSGAARHGEGSSPVNGSQHPALCILVTPV
jgi:hypothetical protein